MKNRYKPLVILLLMFFGLGGTAVAHSNSDSTATKKDTTVTLDLFKSPASPGAALLGIAANDVQKPADPKAFGLHLQSVTNNFTNVPVNFAVDIALAWFFGGRNISFKKYNNNRNLWNNFAQSFVVSTAYKQDTTFKIKQSQFGLGFKFSLIRGKLNDSDTKVINRATNTLKKASTIESLLHEKNKKNYEFYKLMLKRDALKDERIKFLKAQKQFNKNHFLQGDTHYFQAAIDSFNLDKTALNLDNLSPDDKKKAVNNAINVKIKMNRDSITLLDNTMRDFKPKVKIDTAYYKAIAEIYTFEDELEFERSKCPGDFIKIKALNDSISLKKSIIVNKKLGVGIDSVYNQIIAKNYSLTKQKRLELKNSVIDFDKIKSIDEKLAFVQIQKEEYEKNNQDSLEVLLSNLNNEKSIIKLTYIREGWVMDFAGGWAWDYPNNQLNSSKLSKWGGWVVGGYEIKKFSALGMLRYLRNPDKIFFTEKDKETPIYQNAYYVDAGVRLIYENPDKRILVSGEAIRRWVNQDNPLLNVAPSYRLTLNAEYKINDSMALTFVFGRDFDNTITKSGTLVSFLNLLTTFGKTAPSLK